MSWWKKLGNTIFIALTGFEIGKEISDRTGQQVVKVEKIVEEEDYTQVATFSGVILVLLFALIYVFFRHWLDRRYSRLATSSSQRI